MVQLPIDFTSQPSELAGYDNMCMSPGGCDDPPKPPVVTGCLKDMKVEVKCNPDGTYTLTLSGAAFSGTDITLTTLTPGITIVPPQQPYAATTTWTLAGATPGQTITLTANATQAGGGSAPGIDLCCTGEIKVTMPDCPIDLKIAKTTTSPAPDLAFALSVTNNGSLPVTLPPNSIQVTENVPAGLTVNGIGPAPWICAPPAPVAGAAAMVCTYTLGATLAAGQTLLPAINVTALASVSPPGPWKNCATVSLTSTSGLSDSDLGNNTDCLTVALPIDLAIAKTGGTSPAPQVDAYAFHLTVTNVSAAFNGTNIITVTDTVPAGMTFNTAAGTNWTCGTLPASAGSTITCTYTGPGPTAPSQSLGTINIGATALGSSPYPPFTNCATVGLTSGASAQDNNASNDTACVTVVKPPTPCPAPMLPGAIAGQCVCPQGTVQKGRECVRPTVCVPPLVPGPVAGRCICPQGTVQKGRECVRPPACQPPTIAGPAPGVCVCPQGMVRKGRQCVPAVECRAPMIRNPAGTACVCPAGMMQRGRTCVPPTVCNPPARLNRSGACECPANMVARGTSCVPRELRPGDFIRSAPGNTPGGPFRGSPEGPGRR